MKSPHLISQFEYRKKLQISLILFSKENNTLPHGHLLKVQIVENHQHSQTLLVINWQQMILFCSLKDSVGILKARTTFTHFFFIYHSVHQTMTHISTQ